MKKIISALMSMALLAVSMPGLAQDQDETWTEFEESKDGTQLSFRTGSFGYGKNGLDEQVVNALSRIKKPDGEISYLRLYVSTAHCHAGEGKLVAVDLEGEFVFESDYVQSGGNIASTAGDILCGAYASEIEANNEIQQSSEKKLK